MTKDLSISNPIELNPNQDSVESSTVNPTDSTTNTHVEVVSTKQTSTKSKATPKAKTTTPKRTTKKPNKNKIDLSFFDEQEKLIDTMSTYTYENGVDTIDYYPIFDNLKRDALIAELANTVAYCEKNNIDYLKENGALYQYTYFLCIKYFTELYPLFDGLSVEDHIAYLIKIYKTGHFDIFITEILPFEELQKVIDTVKNVEQTAKLIAKDAMLRNKQIDDNIQSPILKDKLKTGMIN